MQWKNVKNNCISIFKSLSKYPDEIWYVLSFIFIMWDRDLPLLLMLLPLIGLIFTILAIIYNKPRAMQEMFSRVGLLCFSVIALFYIETLFTRIFLILWIVIELLNIVSSLKIKMSK